MNQGRGGTPAELQQYAAGTEQHPLSSAEPAEPTDHKISLYLHASPTGYVFRI